MPIDWDRMQVCAYIRQMPLGPTENLARITFKLKADYRTVGEGEDFGVHRYGTGWFTL